MRTIPRKVIVTPARIIFSPPELELIKDYLLSEHRQMWGPLKPFLKEPQWETALAHGQELAQDYECPAGSAAFNLDEEDDVKFRVYDFYGGDTNVALSDIKHFFRRQGFFRGKCYRMNQQALESKQEEGATRQ